MTGGTAEPPAEPSAQPGLVGIARWCGHELLGVHMDKGRIRFPGLTRTERHFTVAGMVLIGGLSLLLLRPHLIPGNMITLYPAPQAESVPTSLPAVFLAVLVILWVLLLEGASTCLFPVPAAGALAFVMLNAQIADLMGRLASGVGAGIVVFAFVLTPVALLAFAVLRLGPVDRRLPAAPRLRAAARAGYLAGIVMFFGTALWMYVQGLRRWHFRPPATSALVADIAVPIQYLVDNLYFVLVILLIIASLAVVRFAYDLAKVVNHMARRLPAGYLRASLISLMATEVFFIAWRYRRSLHLLISYPLVVVLSALGIVLAAGFALLFRPLFAVPREEVETGTLTLLGAATYAIPLITYGVVVTASFLYQFLFPTDSGLGRLNPFSWLGQHVMSRPAYSIAAVTVPFGVMFLVGLRRADRGRGPEGRRWMAGLALISGWALWTFMVSWVSYTAMFPLLVDDAALIITAAVAIDLARHWRTAGATRLAFLTALVAFGWLVSTGRRFVDLVGSLFHLGPSLPLVFGLFLVIVGASEFCGRESGWLPRGARPLLWTGYLGFSLLLSVWLQFTKGYSSIGVEQNLDLALSYLLIAPPFATWLVLNGRFAEHASRPAREQPQQERAPAAVGPAADSAGDGA